MINTLVEKSVFCGLLDHFGLYADPHYASGETEKVALLNDGRLLIGTSSEDGEGYTFSIRIIPPTAVPKTTSL